MEVLPNFIIVGAMKSGTSSLSQELQMHPNIFMPKRELHFFNDDAAYQKGLGYYSSLFNGWGGQKAIGEKTPTYSYAPQVAERIARFDPKIKLVWIFREPVSRAYSHYCFFVSMGKENLSFEKALERDTLGRCKDFTMRYKDRSVYISQIKNYLNFFPMDQMLFLKLDDLHTNRVDTLAHVCGFLGVDASFNFPQLPQKENTTKMPKSILLQYLAYQLFHKKGARILRFVKAINRKSIPGYPELSEKTRAELCLFYQPCNKLLAELTGLDLSNW
ncbi:MAG: sulfotransferase [Anaerolineales bacterium]